MGTKLSHVFADLPVGLLKLLPSSAWKASTGQSAVTLRGCRVKAGIHLGHMHVMFEGQGRCLRSQDEELFVEHFV